MTFKFFTKFSPKSLLNIWYDSPNLAQTPTFTVTCHVTTSTVPSLQDGEPRHWLPCTILFHSGALGNLKNCDISYCSGCKLIKFPALPFNQSIFVSSSPFDLIHSNVWGPSPVATKGGSRYYISFIDDHTCYCWVYLMKTSFWILWDICSFSSSYQNSTFCCDQMF